MTLEANSKAGIIAATVGVAGSGAVAVNATGFGNVITNTVEASVMGDSTVSAAGLIDQTAKDQSNIRSVGVSIAGTGGIAAGALIGANVITNSITALVSGSTISSGSTLNLSAKSDASILGITFGVAGSGAGAGLLSLSANVVSNAVKAGVINEGATSSDVDASGAVTISASNSSTIDALAFGIAGSGGVALGAALSANVITSSTQTCVIASTLDSTNSSITLSADSAAVIRSIALGVSGSGGFALQVTAVGNVIVDEVSSIISGASIVQAKSDVTLSATNTKPGSYNALATPSDQQAKLDAAMADSPITLTSANILSVVVGVAGSGSGAVNVTLVGNTITTAITADIDGSTVTSTLGNIQLNASSSASIVGVTAGVAAAGGVALSATGLGNVITGNMEATIKGGSTVTAGGSVIQSATNSSSIASIGLSFAAGGMIGGSALVAINTIANTLSADINASTVSSGSAIQLTALSDADIFSFVGGVAVSGIGAGNLSLAVNNIHNNVDASIINSTSVKTTGTGNIELTATDSSTVDSIAVGLSAALGGAIGAAVSINDIAHGVHAAVTNSGVISGGNISLAAQSVPVIRSFAAGVAISGGISGQASVTSTTIANTVDAAFTGSTVTALGSISLSASDKAPSTVTTASNDVTSKIVETLLNNKDSKGNKVDSVDSNANIVAFAGNIAGASGVALGAAVVTNTITNAIKAEIVNSTVTSSASDVNVTAIFETRIAALAAGFSAGGSGAVNASVVTNTIATTTTADITGKSTVSAAGTVGVSATDTVKADSLAFSLAASLGAGLGGSVVSTTITDTTQAYISGTSAAVKASIVRANLLALAANSNYSVTGRSLGVSAGSIAVGASVTTATIGGSTSAYIGNYTDIGYGVGSVHHVTVTAKSIATVHSTSFGLSGGLVAGNVNSALATINPTVSAYIADADIIATGDIGIAADAAVTAETDVIGVTVGLGAIGTSLSRAQIKPVVAAYVGLGASITGRNLITLAHSNAGADAYGNASGGGLFSGNGADVDAEVTPILMGFIGDNVALALSGILAVTSKSEGKSKSKAKGITVGLIGVGVMLSDSVLSPTINTYIGSNTAITATGGITVQSLHNTNANGTLIDQGAEAYADASGGGLVSANGAVSNATGTAAMATGIAAGSTLTTTAGDIIVSSLANNIATSKGGSLTIGLAAVGAVQSTARSTGSTTAHIDSSIVTAGHDLTVKAAAFGTATSTVDAAAGGLIGVGVNTATATIKPDVHAYIGTGATVTATNKVTVAGGSNDESIRNHNRGECRPVGCRRFHRVGRSLSGYPGVCRCLGKSSSTRHIRPPDHPHNRHFGGCLRDRLQRRPDRRFRHRQQRHG